MRGEKIGGTCTCKRSVDKRRKEGGKFGGGERRRNEGGGVRARGMIQGEESERGRQAGKSE